MLLLVFHVVTPSINMSPSIVICVSYSFWTAWHFREEEVKYLIEWYRSPEHHRQWPVSCMTKDAKSVFRKRAHKYEFDSTTNTLFKRETNNGESKALSIYINIKNI